MHKRANGDSLGGRSRLRCGEERCKSYLLGLLGLLLPKRLADSKTGAASAHESQRRNARSQTDRQINNEVAEVSGRVQDKGGRAAGKVAGDGEGHGWRRCLLASGRL